MTGGTTLGKAVRGAAIAVLLSASLLIAPAAGADTVDVILDLVLQSLDPSLVEAKHLLKCAIDQGGLNSKTLQVCGGGMAKAEAYLASDSTAQTVVAVGIAASKKQWGK